MLDPTAGERPQTSGEEIANSVSHGVGALALLAAVPYLIAHAAQHRDASTVVGVSVFSFALLFLYFSSTLYHALPRGKAKHLFRLIEHSAIFVLIAGTYTPFTLSVLRGAWGWSLFGIIWTLALAGVLLKVVAGIRYPTLSTILYVSMGWVVIIAAHPLWQRMPHAGTFCLLLGGVAYTGGVAFYAADHRLKYSHFVWHLFVMAGSAIHFLTVLWYIA